MGRLVFDNLKKVTLYLMPVSQCIVDNKILTYATQGWKLHGVHGSGLKCCLWNANSFELLPTSLFLHHK
jgi:hypothetical protein